MCPAVFAFAGEGLEGLWLCFGFVTSVVVVFLAVRGAVKRSVRTLQTAFGIAVVVQTLEMFFCCLRRRRIILLIRVQM